MDYIKYGMYKKHRNSRLSSSFILNTTQVITGDSFRGTIFKWYFMIDNA